MNFKKLKLNKNSKIKLKCFFTLILVFTMVISSIPNINVFANESYDYEYTGNEINGYVTIKELSNGKGHITPKLFEVKHTTNVDDISEVYCLDVDTQHIETDINYSISDIEDGDYYTDEEARKIRAIMKNSYPYIGADNIADLEKHLKTKDSKFELSLIEAGREDLAIKAAITATQLAIWYYSNDEFDTEIRPNLKDMDGNWIKDPEIKGFIRSDVEKIYDILLSLDAEDAEEPVAKILSKEPIIVSENGDTVDIEFRFKIDGNNVDDKMNYTIENKPVDSKIIEYYELDEDGYKRIRVTNIPSGENIKFIISGIQYINKDVFLYKPEGGREASQTLIGARSGKINISKTFDYKCTFGEVEVTKVDSKNENIRLEGAEFTIKNNSNGQVAKVITTNKDGTASTRLLPGEYTIEETKAPEGYKSTEDKKTFTISESESKKISFEFENKKLVPTSVAIEGNKVLEGKDLEAGMFRFELLDEEGNVIEVVENSEEGKVQFAAITYDKEGTYEYKVREVEGNLEGITYDKKEFTVKVNVTDDGEGKLVAEVVYPEGGIEFKNSYKAIKGSVKLIKVDKDDNEEKIQGTKFVLLASDKKTIIAENLVTDSEGKIIVSNLEPGTYYFKEIEATSGYILDDTLAEVNVKFNQQEIETVIFENKKKQEVVKPVTKPNIGSPKTSDTSIAGYTISSMVAVGSLVFINKKRKNK